MSRLVDLISVCKSKNAGPGMITIDIFAPNTEVYDKIKDSDIISKEVISDSYNIEQDSIVGIYELPEVHAFKFTIKRPIFAGDIEDRDMYGSQQHLPILRHKIEE